MTPDEITERDRSIGAFWHLAPQPGGAGPLAGMTLGVKDNIAVAGMPWTAGLNAFRDRVAHADAPCVAALRGAGAAILGKLAMHEGALGATTDVPRLCHNPRRHGHTPGGSSGGSAAAVAAGFVQLALGTDTMGSVRIPAAYCGVVGLKPTAGLVPRSLVEPLSHTLDHVGILAATPQDAARALAAMVAVDPADPASRPAPPGWHALTAAPPRLAGMRIGIPDPVLNAPVEPALRHALDQAARSLGRRGAEVADLPMPGWDPGAARRAGLLLIEAEAAAIHHALLEDPRAASPAFRAALAYGRDAGAVRIVRALHRLAETRAAALHALDACELLLLPTTPQRAFPHGTPPPADQADFTALANIAGLPAIALPWPVESGGLPASVQLVGPPHAEALLTAVAALLMSR
jgi:aspartyl-tRNA(Asn)/glutamyl-tRNA(Gln) amidotransferase subunit A